jgi:class 3 adenylate cyclase
VNLASALFVSFERNPTFVAFGISTALFVAGQLTFAGTPALAFSQWVNGASFALTCLFFSRMLYAAKTRDFWQRETIARQNAELTAANDKLADERAKSENLLRAALPPRIVERLQRGETRIADAHAAVTILWADLCGFTELASALPPAELVDLLDELFSSFDAVVHAFGLEKIKTVGDGYLAVAGIAEPNDLDVVAAAGAGLALHRAVSDVSARRGRALSLRVGIARGPAMAGVLGRERLLYDLWGDAVNVAARLETAARPGETLITSDAARSIADAYALGPEVVLDLKGKGTMTVRSVITRR